MYKYIYKCVKCRGLVSVEIPEEQFLSFDCPLGHGQMLWLGANK